MPVLYVILAPLFIMVPPVPTTSKSNVPPDNTRAPLIIIFPPVPGDIPKVPELSVNEPGLLRLIVKKSADKILLAGVA